MARLLRLFFLADIRGCFLPPRVAEGGVNALLIREFVAPSAIC